MPSIPNDPIMLLSFTNTQLRDHYRTLAEFCEAYEIPEDALKEKLSAVDYVYDEECNQFV